MKYTYTIIAVFLILMLVIGAFLITVNSDGTWDTDWETDGNMTGSWGEEIIVKYEDGTTDSLKILEENQNNILAVKYNDKEIVSASYRIYATATGKGFTGCEIDSFTVNTMFYKFESGSKTIFTGPFETTVSPDVFDLGIEKHICDIGCPVKVVLGSQTPGEYGISWAIVDDDIRYRGVPDGSWQTVDCPPGRSLTVDVISDNEIYLTLESSFGTG